MAKHPFKTRVVYTINHIRKSGPNEVLWNMVKSINTKRYDVTVISFLKDSDSQEAKKLTDLGVSLICLEFERKMDILRKGPDALKEILETIKPDIIHSHGILSDIASYKSGHKSKYISTIHNNIFEDYRYTFGFLKGIFFAIWHLGVLRKFDKAVGCSETAYSAIKKYLPNSTFVRNGIDFTSHSNPLTMNKIRKNLKISKNDTVYIYAGKLSKRKNVITLLESFRSARTVNEHLMLIGDGELRKQCESYADSNTHILGFKSDVASYLDVSDIYISASNSEGLSISVIEALDKGLRVLLSDIASHREFFTIDKTVYIGELFLEGDLQANKNKIKNRPADKKQTTLFKKKYLSARSMMESYEVIYEEVLR